jgi:hypothetical protein
VSSPALEPCVPGDLLATAGPIGGGAGSRGADVTVAAKGGTCMLSASPAVAVIDAAGTEVLHSRLPLTAEGPVIEGSATYTFSFQLSNWCDTAVPTPLTFQVVLAAGPLDIGGLSMAGGDLPPCNGPGEPPAISATDWQPS